MKAPPRIAVLPAALANQIAAGEVVERPASVVKELCENALDAGARRVEVEIERGGLHRIRITDDGSGMTPEEAELALLRHATSKLRSLEDLFHLHTMGFRGEALPSIAAVSRFQLTTRTADAVGAVRLQHEGGVAAGPPREAGAQVGTQIEIADLFYNVPARLKFMKGEATEAAHVSEAVLRLALAHHEVHFRLRHNGRVVLDLPQHSSALERAQAALSGRGKGAGKAALYAASGAEGEVQVEAYLGAPSDSSATPRNVYLLMNRRFIRDRSLLHAAVMGYGEILDRGRYPLLALHLTIPAGKVDVNVHPQKLEVRFESPQEVYGAVRHVLRKTAVKAPWLLPERLDPAPGAGRVYRLDEDEPLPGAAEPAPAYQRYGGPGPAPAFAPRSEPVGLPSGLSEHRARLHQALRPYPPAPLPQREPLQQVLPTPPPQEEVEPPPGRRFFSVMRYLGQLGRTYLLCESTDSGELLLIDQHAAHESLAYQRLLLSASDRALRAQRLLLPLQLELDPQRAAVCEEEQEALAELGFEVRPLSGRSFALASVPDAAEFGRGARIYQDPARLFDKVLDDLVEGGGTSVVRARKERVLATIACHTVVRAGDALDEQRARALLCAMDEVDFVPNCPHGRPVLVRVPRQEIERRFGRA